MKVKTISSEIHYILTYKELTDMLQIPDTEKIDFIEISLDPHNETIIIKQIEPHDTKRPRSDT